MTGPDDSWVDRLTASGLVRDDALAALRVILISRLRKAFQGHRGVDEALIEDVAQDALIKTLDNLAQFQEKSRFTTWATTIAVRVAFTELRRRHWRDVSLEQILEDAPPGAEQTIDMTPGPQVELERKAFVEEMYRIVDNQLTEKQRTALLAELNGMPLEEIGRRMDSNRNAIYKLTHDARKRLKQGLEAAGFSLADLQTA